MNLRFEGSFAMLSSVVSRFPGLFSPASMPFSLRSAGIKARTVCASLALVISATVPAMAQVTFTGSQPSVNFGSQAIASPGAAQTLSFSISAGTTVGSIGIFTQGSAGLDFADAGSSTCTATTYSMPTSCAVKVKFTPAFAGTRSGAVVFFSDADNTGTVLASVAVYGVGTGPQIAYSPGVATAIDPRVDGKGLFGPWGVAIDGAGDLFIADYGYNRVVEAPAGGGAARIIDASVNGIGLAGTTGVAVDAAGDLFIADIGNNRVVEVPAGGGAATAIAPTVNSLLLSYPEGLAVDGAGDLFIADTNNNRVVEVPAGGGAATAIVPTVNGLQIYVPVGVAVDGTGDLFIADTGNSRVVEVPAGGGAATAIDPTVNGKGLSYPYGVSVDSAGNLFIADTNNYRVVEVPAGGGAATAIAPTVNSLPLSYPEGLAVDGAGNLFIADDYGRVVEVNRSQPPTVNFPTAAVAGTTDTADGTQTVQVQNIGNQPLTVTEVRYPADFPEHSGDPNACTASTSLNAGKGCDLPINFAPQTTGSLSENLTLTDNNLNASPDAMQNIPLTGTALLTGTATVTVDSLEIPSGTATATLTASVSYNSSPPSGAFTFQVDTGAVSTASCTGSSSPRTCTVSYDVSSLPAGWHTITGVLTADSSYSATSGTGTLIVEVSSNVGSSSATQTAPLLFTTNATLNSTLSTAIRVTTQGAVGLDFTYAAGGSCAAGTTYAAGQTCTVNYTFTPKAPGQRLGAIQLYDNSATPVPVATVYLNGIGTGPQIAYGPGIATAIAPTVNGSGIDGPRGVAVDAAGDLFLADTYNNRVVKVPAGGGAATAIDPTVNGIGLFLPVDVAVDGAGNLFIASDGGVVVVPAGGGAATNIDPIVNGAGVDEPWGVAVDAAGDLFIADTNNNRVVEVPAGGGAATAIAPTVNGKGLSYPDGVSVDGEGDLFIADTYNNRVVKVPASGGAATAIDPTVNGKGLSHPYDVSVDGEGDLFIADENNRRVVEVPAASGAATAIHPIVNGNGLKNPNGVAVDSAGNLFIADAYADAYSAGGFEVNHSQLPAVNFPTATTPGKYDTADGTQIVQIQNIGNQPLAFTGISYPADFPEHNGNPNPCTTATSLNTGVTCDLPIYFAPKTTGSLSESLVLTDNNLNASPDATQSIQLTGTALLWPPTGHIDVAGDSVTLSATVGQADSLEVGGWAADPLDGAPLANVKVYIDGALAGTPALGIARPDVAADQNNKDYLDSGYHLLYPASSLTLGTHAVTVIAIDSGGRSTTFGPVTVTVATTAGLGAPFGSIDVAGDSVTHSVTVSQSGSLEVSGWVADLQDGSPLANVKVYIDGTLAGTPTLGIARPYVAKSRNNNAYLDSGYRFITSASGLSSGTHVVTVVAIDSGGRSTTLGPRTINVQ
jgi:sugar lactone lactonase YvrE